MSRGIFISFEGAEGSGKSTQAELLRQALTERGLPVLLIREPGGVVISEQIRGILLDVANTAMTKECETLLYMAARAQLVEEVIAPALKTGRIVLCDRFLDSTVVYQGDGNGVDKGAIRRIGHFATRGILPELTLLFDIDAAEGLARRGAEKDRIEQRPLDYHRRVREGYLLLAREDPVRVKVIPADQTREDIQRTVQKHVDALLAAAGGPA